MKRYSFLGSKGFRILKNDSPWVWHSRMKTGKSSVERMVVVLRFLVNEYQVTA